MDIEKMATITAAMSTCNATVTQKLQPCDPPMAAPAVPPTTPMMRVRRQPRGLLFGTTSRANAPMMRPMTMPERIPVGVRVTSWTSR